MPTDSAQRAVAARDAELAQLRCDLLAKTAPHAEALPRLATLTAHDAALQASFVEVRAPHMPLTARAR